MVKAASALGQQAVRSPQRIGTFRRRRSRNFMAQLLGHQNFDSFGLRGTQASGRRWRIRNLDHESAFQSTTVPCHSGTWVDIQILWFADDPPYGISVAIYGGRCLQRCLLRRLLSCVEWLSSFFLPAKVTWSSYLSPSQQLQTSDERLSSQAYYSDRIVSHGDGRSDR